ncbi:uncharacterized protein LOC126899417 isoform X2 [Daktulosphaira vitifoliae]|uniref:uncharacterized protein LOC126899417 isoform X2 n=1 Tax=Daktulosphaira vitifoliae TaxID=58002 RepID=UPI0021AA2846|nr:uncharacterized protein LOC126899417 isoform X2 [Daktulosphaira vitifoliae]
MASLKLVSKSLLLFCVALCIQSHRNTQRNTRIMNNLFKCVGWKNLKYVKYVTYFNKIYDLSSIIKEKIVTETCNKKIRGATIFLGCTYASILIDIVQSVEYQQKFCKEIMNNQFYKSQSHNFIVKLLDVISNITLFTKKMHGALNAIDKLHTIQLQLNTSAVMLKVVFQVFQNLQVQVNNYFASCNDLKDNCEILNNIDNKIIQIRNGIRGEIDRYCRLESETSFLFMPKFNVEYNKQIVNEETIQLYISGNEIILNGIKMLNTENFTELGFEFNSNTGETFIRDSLDHQLKETVNESKTSPATNPAYYDFLQKGNLLFVINV